MSQVTKSKKHKCATCGQGFDTKSGQKQHSRVKHPRPASQAVTRAGAQPSVEPETPFTHRGIAYSSLSAVEQNAMQGRLSGLCHSEQRLRKEGYSLTTDTGTQGESCLMNRPDLPGPNMGQPAAKTVAIVLDCEMAGTGCGEDEVIQITMVDFLSGSVLQSRLVNPSRPIVDWREDITGIDFPRMQEAIAKNEALNGWQAARSELWRFADKETIIIGQSVHNDLKVLHMSHARIIDSAIITADAVLGKNSKIRKRWGLQALCHELLDIEIRKPSPLDGRGVHDALEDALATRELVLLCLRNPDKLERWAKKTKIAFHKGNGNKKMPPRAGGSRSGGVTGRNSVDGAGVAKVYALQDVPGKGLGLVATTKIIKGTRILSESPLLRVPQSTNSKKGVGKVLSKDIAALGDNERQAFFSLYNAFKDDVTIELGIVRTNALPLGSNASAGGVFVEASRINHACVQNAQNTWNENLQQLTIHAIRDIDEGEEITIMYLRDRTNRAARQLALQLEFRFTCSCDLCSLPPSERSLSDTRLDEICRLDESIGDGMQIIAAPLQALQNVRKLLRLCEEEGINDATIPRAYYDAFQIAIINSDVARAQVFAQRAAASRVVVEGDDSSTVSRLRELARDPTRHASYGIAAPWKTSTNDVPSGLEASDFTAWLWREQQKTEFACIPKSMQAASEYADLRDNAMFPSFTRLPEENDLDLDFFESKDGFSYRPRKHWCFLAEIVDIEHFIRLKLIVKDKAGQEVPVSFYTPRRGGELDPSSVRKRSTLAILYGEQHGFLDMTVGIRHETPESLKIFPVTHDELLKLSDRVQQYSAESNGERTCQGCGQKAPTLKKCVRCTLFWYCDKACQTLAWNEKGHKGDCKLLSDRDLRGLLHLPQNGFQEHYEFTVG